VEAFNVVNNTSLGAINPYGGFIGGAYVGVGDFNNDGRADIVTGAGAGGGPHVRVWSGANLNQELGSFFAYNAGFTGGVRVSAVDFNKDGRADIVTGPGPGGGPDVRVFNAANLGTPLFGVFPYNVNFTGGVYVAGSLTSNALLQQAAPDALAAASTTSTYAAGAVDTEGLNRVVDQARAIWATLGLTDAQRERLNNMSVELADLQHGRLGAMYPTAIYIDRDASGIGWFVDSTPGDNEEFDLGSDGLYRARGEAAGRMDLLSTVLHELGHAIGLDDLDAMTEGDEVMAGVLGAGVRRLPTDAALDALYGSDEFEF
jgi:hypothetical protein